MTYTKKFNDSNRLYKIEQKCEWLTALYNKVLKEEPKNEYKLDLIQDNINKLQNSMFDILDKVYVSSDSLWDDYHNDIL